MQRSTSNLKYSLNTQPLSEETKQFLEVLTEDLFSLSQVKDDHAKSMLSKMNQMKGSYGSIPEYCNAIKNLVDENDIIAAYLPKTALFIDAKSIQPIKLIGVK